MKPSKGKHSMPKAILQEKIIGKGGPREANPLRVVQEKPICYGWAK